MKLIQMAVAASLAVLACGEREISSQESASMRVASGSEVVPPAQADSGWEAFEEGDLGEARRVWEARLREAEERRDDDAVAQALLKIAYVSEYEGKLSEAIALLERAVSLLSNENPRAFVASQRLADLYERAGAISSSEEEHQSLVSRFDGETEAARSKRGMMLLGLARHYSRQGRSAEAEQAYLEGIRVLESIPSHHIGIELHLAGLSQLYASQGRLGDAADTCTRRVREFLDVYATVPDGPRSVDECAKMLESVGRAVEADEFRIVAEGLRRGAPVQPTTQQ